MIDVNYTKEYQKICQLLPYIGVLLPKFVIKPVGYLYSKLLTEKFEYCIQNPQIPLSSSDYFFRQNKLIYPHSSVTCFIINGTSKFYRAVTTTHSLVNFLGFTINSNDKSIINSSTIKSINSELLKYHVVLGEYILKAMGESEYIINNKNIYNIEIYKKDDYCDDIIYLKLTNFLPSLPHIKEIEMHKIKLEKGMEAFYLGHPLSTPMKYVSGELSDFNNCNLETNLPSFSGTSGSPLFTFDKGPKLIGVMNSSTRIESPNQDTCSFEFKGLSGAQALKYSMHKN